VTEFDRQLGRLLDQLHAAGALEDTLIVITSDHGRLLGAHGIDGHNFGAFEEMYRIPLIVSGPGIAPGVTSAHAGLQDLCPTLLDLAGAETIDVPDSRSLRPVLESPQEGAKGFTSAYAEHEGTRFLHTQRVIWEGDWKFVFNPFAEDELYNLAEDPHELQNLAERPEQAHRVRALQSAIWERARTTGEHGLADAQYFTMQFAAVGPDSAAAADRAEGTA
jgi:arylsulfatase A-like enzyme